MQFSNGTRRLSVVIGGIIALVAAHGAQASTLTALVSFNRPTNGANPLAGLMIDSAGNLYGTNSQGPSAFSSVLFKLANGAGTPTALGTFGSGKGFNVQCVPLADASGNLYGTTGGANNNPGTLFKYNASTGALATLASFNGTNGSNSDAGLIADAPGNLYGTSSAGGTNNIGTVFKYDASTASLTALASFNGANGGGPHDALIEDAAGNFYGTTTFGGISGKGTIFKLDAATGVLAPLASFNGTNGAYPYGDLIMDAAGNFYGTTSEGGVSGFGTIFKLGTTGILTTLVDFNDVNGGVPYCGLIADALGDLYGTTYGGSLSGAGTVFKFSLATGTLTTLAAFDGSNGKFPRGGVVADSTGNLYGTTYQGGANGASVGGYGTIFEVTDSGFAVPEPSSVCLLGIGAVALLRRHR